MEANELMIGDWVLDGKNIAQIVLITCDGIIETTFNESSNIELIEPIPLTPEILEKNGFEGNNHYQYIYKDNFCKVCVSFAPRIEIDNMDLGEPPIHVSIKGALFDIKMCISSIHQLQHALRLCGIEKEIIL